jgi:hypothetical protein
MKILKNQLIFLLSAALFLALGVLVSGVLNHYLPEPFHFFGALAVTIASIMLTMKWTDMTGWQFTGLGLGCLLFSVWAGFQVNHYMAERFVRKADNVKVEEYDDLMQLVTFSDARLAKDSVFTFVSSVYGTHHYFIVPIVSKDKSDAPIRLWAWTAIMNQEEATFEDTYLATNQANFGLALNTSTPVGILKQAVNGARKDGLNVDKDPVFFKWGLYPDPEFHAKLLVERYLIALGAIFGLSVFGIFFRKKKPA